ncbi:MAG: hypothetical protein ACR2MD_03135 [Aridibacter sp.]
MFGLKRFGEIARRPNWFNAVRTLQRPIPNCLANPSRPFYRLGKMLFIGKLPRPEFSRFLRDKFSREGFFSPQTHKDKEIEIIDVILDLAEDVPYNVQMPAHTIWDKLAQI